MTNNKPSLDGFVPRRASRELGSVPSEKKAKQNLAAEDRTIHSSNTSSRAAVGQARPGRAIGRADIDDSLREIDQQPYKESRKSRRARKNSQHPRRAKVRKIIKWVVIALALLLVGIGGYLIYKAVNASDSVFQGSVLDLVKNDPLKEDANGRTNFLIFGTEAEGHPGANLTDSIMVMSLDQDKKDVYMMSLPRDLWVEYAEQCTVGDHGKLNNAYFCASNDGEDPVAGATALAAQAESITGLAIQYTLQLNWAALIESVNAVGGIDVTIQTDNPNGILDRNFDASCNFTCYYVKYKQGEVAHLDGVHALALARARNANGGYGLERNNFDRERNQQLIIKALRQKALSAGTLTNIGAVTSLIDSLGNNVTTNIQTKEIRTLMQVASEIKDENIISLSLDTADPPLVTTGNYSGQSIVRAVPGLLDYSEIIAFVNKNVNSTAITREDPHVSVLNGGRAAGVAQIQADTLTDQGFTVDTVDNAPDGTYGKVEIYQIATDKPASAAKLKELYGVAVKTTAPPTSVVGDTDFLIILGPES